MKGSGLLNIRKYKRRNPENQYSVVKVNMKKRPKKEWKQLIKDSRENARRSAYDIPTKGK